MSKKEEIINEIDEILSNALPDEQIRSGSQIISGGGNHIQVKEIEGNVTVDQSKTVIINPGKKRHSAKVAGIIAVILILPLLFSIQNDGIKKSVNLYTPAMNSASIKMLKPKSEISIIPASIIVNPEIKPALYLTPIGSGCARRCLKINTDPSLNKI